jgi:hypothetical protein
MKKFDPTQLIYFTGTEKYYQLSDATPFGQTPLLRQNPNHLMAVTVGPSGCKRQSGAATVCRKV